MGTPNYIDVVVDIPELDNYNLLGGVEISVKGMDTDTPTLYLGDNKKIVYKGRFNEYIGSTIILSRSTESASSGAAVSVVSKTSKRVVFTREKGSWEDVLALLHNRIKHKRRQKRSGAKSTLVGKKKPLKKSKKVDISGVEDEEEAGSEENEEEDEEEGVDAEE